MHWCAAAPLTDSLLAAVANDSFLTLQIYYPVLALSSYTTTMSTTC